MRRLLACAALVMALASCEKSTGEIGLDFVDGSQFAFGTKKAVALRAFTESFDSLETLRPAALLVGSYDDPVFGRPTASFATQLVLSSVAPDFGTNATVDSVFMILPYSGWYGDTTAPFEIKVHRSADELTDSVYYAFSTAALGAQRCASNSPTRRAGCVGSRCSTSFRYAYGASPFSRADCTRLMTAAARWPARKEPANNQFARPSAMGRIWFSTQLLSMGSCPSSR